VTAPGHPPAALAPFIAAGVAVLTVPAAPEGGLDLRALLAALARRGVTRILAEGGAGIAAALLRANLVDRLAWFHAPGVMGAEGLPAAEGLRLAALAAMPRFRRLDVRPMGADVMTEFERLEMP
jgi:diaminohydroxyphosphoribosylaminopyrimidine deaminase/5-amino-6-(5-phosphoribosylamino)uracil reductase